MNQEQETPEQVRKQYERRIEHFLKKKGVLGVKENLAVNLEKFMLEMKKAGMNPDSNEDFELVRRGIAPENVLIRFAELNKSKIIADGTFGYHFKKAKESGELAQIDKEFDEYNKVEQQKVEREANLKEAQDRYAANPTKENMIKVISEDMRMKASQEEHIDGPVDMGISALREKLFKESVEAKKLGKKMKAENPKAFLDIPDQRQCNEERVAFEEATTAAANEELSGGIE